MKFTVNLEFDTPEEMADFFQKNTKVEPAQVKVIKDIVSVSRHTRRENKQFEQFELDFIIDNYLKHSAREIGASLGRTPSAISQKIHALRKEGLIGRKNNRNGKPIENKIQNNL